MCECVYTYIEIFETRTSNYNFFIQPSESLKISTLKKYESKNIFISWKSK